MVNEGEAYFSAFTLCTHACPFLFMQHSFVYMKLTFKHKKTNELLHESNQNRTFKTHENTLADEAN